MLVVAAIVVLVWVPGVPGHHQASLLGDLAASDANTALTRSLPLVGDHPPRTCPRLESEFETSSHLFRDYEIGWYASIWSSYQALNALYVGSLSSGGRACRTDFTDNVSAIDAFYWDTSYGKAPATFDQGPTALHFHRDPPRVDDSLWMGLAVDRDYLLTRDPAYLRRAEAVFRMAIGNWDSKKGGIYWENHADGGTDAEKAVVSNAPAVMLGAALYSETGVSSYLTWSTRILHWVKSTLLDVGSGLYDDHVGDNNRSTAIDTTKLTYNQGVMVGATAALARVDPGHYTLADAIELADRSMAYFRAHRTYGAPALDAIWGQYLLWTAGLYKNEAFAGRARSSLEAARRDEPGHPADLLERGAETTLQELVQLPARQYPELSDLRSPLAPVG